MSEKLTSQFNNEAVLAQLGDSVIAKPSLQIAADKQRLDNPDSQEAKDKKLRDFIDLVDAVSAYIEQLQKDIEELETGFRARDGDAWREKLALKILDADDIPQRRSDESMEDYRERLEPILVEKMLNDDGSPKAHYADNPELSDYAQWAQKKNHLNIARGYVRELEDPNTPPERKAGIENDLKQSADLETLVFAELNAVAGSDVQGAVKIAIDEIDDNTLSSEQSAASLSSLMKPPS